MIKEHLTAIDEQPCVGLFGSCGNTTFRQTLFIPAYKREGMRYFNPQLPVGTWKPENALIEADHLAYDCIQIWPITGETYSGGSLSEMGFSLANSISAESPLPKFVIPWVEMQLDDSLTNEEARAESLRARHIANENLSRSNAPGLLRVYSLEQMLDTSITIYPAVSTIVDLMRTNNPAFQRFRAGRGEHVVFREALERGLRSR